MKRLFFVRHGSAENPKGIIYRRLPGFHLSEMGIQEATAARDNLAGVKYEVVYHSPLERTTETAKIVNHLNAPLIVEERINEWDEFESAADIVKRMDSFWHDWLANSVETAIAVAHRDSIRVLLLNLTGSKDAYMPLNNLALFPLPQAGVYQVTHSEEGIKIEPHFARDDLPSDFLAGLSNLETSYLSHEDPERQSGFAGGETRWRHEREIILDAIDGGGDFVDLGCANGYLLECLVKWAQEKGRNLVPFGVDVSERLVSIAKDRMPEYKNNFEVANCWHWRPKRKFQYVYTLFDCVPEHLFGFYVHRLLHEAVAPGGKLIVGSYGNVSANQPARNMALELRKRSLPISGSKTVGDLPATSIAWIER